MNRVQAEAHLIEKAQSDKIFRQKLIEDPAGAILSEFGIAITPSIKVTVIEETADSAYLVLPAQQAEELSEQQLATVAGGVTQITNAARKK